MNILAKANAVKLIDRYCYDSPSELNLEELLYAENLKLKEEPLLNCEGKILFDGTMGIITVNSNFKDHNQKRFTISHEMGHFFNEKALTPPNLPFGKGEELNRVVFYRCGFESFYGKERNIIRESNANDFAAELLMHDEWFVKSTANRKFSKTLLQETANLFSVSLTAAAIRYSELGYYPTAVIMVKEEKVAWKAINEKFSYQFCKIGSSISSLSYVHNFCKGEKVPEGGDDIPAEAWFPEDFGLRKKRDARIWELVFPFPKHSSALVMLWEV